MRDVVQVIRQQRVVGILRKLPVESIEEVGSALLAGGLRVVEVTLDSPEAADMIRRLGALGDQWFVGAGTALDGPSARYAILAGAQFLVTPAVSREVIETGNRYGKPVLTGAMTPTEILAAWEAGSALVKVFPAGSLGPDYIRQVRGPLSQIPMVAVGGVDASNARTFLDAGAVAVGVGSGLVQAQDIAAGQFDAITARVHRLLEAVTG